MNADQQDQQLQLPLKERVDTGVALAYGQQGYVQDGQPDQGLLSDVIYGLVTTAVVEKTAERGTKAITRTALVEKTFPNVPGAEAWDEQDDPELAEGIYKRLDGTVWRMVNDDVSGSIQERLNGDQGLILCRTQATPGKQWAVYVTRDLGCLLLDFSGPHKAKLKKAADRYAANLVMATDRLPQHAKKFQRELTTGMRTALDGSVAILKPAIEAATAGEGVDGDEE